MHNLLLVIALLTAWPGLAPARAAGAMPDALLTAADRLAVEKRFNGVILVADRTGTRLEKGYGHAVFETATASSAATRYQTGSFSKWVATVIVLALVDRGVLELDAPIGRYLPDYRGEGKPTVTLHHLVSHTSGVPNDLAAALRTDPVLASYADIAPAQAVERFASGALTFAPGEQFDYSHSNWLLVRAIIEAATGKSYARNVEDLLLDPLALHDSGIMPPDFEAIGRVARGYVSLDPAPRAAPRERTHPIPDLIGPIGGFYATARDLATLLDGVYRGPVLTDASRAKLWTVVATAEGYAYGGRVRDVPGRGTGQKASWNNNSNGPYKSLMVHTAAGTTVVFLNNTGMAGADLAEMATALLDVEASADSADAGR